MSRKSGQRLAMTSAIPSSCRHLDRFCALVLADVAVQQTLRQPDRTEAFVAQVVDTGRRHGFVFEAQDVTTAMRANRPGPGVRSSVARETGLPPKGWLPARAFWQDGDLWVDWTYFGERRLREPFFQDSLRLCLSEPFNRLFRYSTPIARLSEWLAVHPGLAPSGFIFHMSRCGSTLVSQMLAAVAHNIVISEASPIDAVVQARHARPDLTVGQHALWLASMVGALGHKRSGGERHLFVKLDSWHTLALPLFRRAFPSVPWIFLYRDPVEVLVSQVRQRGIQTVPGLIGADVLGIEAGYAPHQPEDYCARVLATVCEPVAGQYREGRALLVNYRELPAAVETRILPHFQVKPDDGDRGAMAAAARQDAKTPGMQFSPDAERKQQAATPTIRSAVRARLAAIHSELEELRRQAAV
jgi:hypothetical protein